MAAQYLVLDIGGTFIKYALMDAEANSLEEGKVPSDTSGEQAVLSSLALVAERFADRDYAGVAISMPGRIDMEKGIAHTGGAFEWLKDYPAAERYGAVFGKPCTIANDGKCAAYAESWRGALADVDSGAVLVLGTGIGGGIVLNREVWMGCSGGAGELSVMPVDYDAYREGADPGRARRGMWTERISAKTLVDTYRERTGREDVDGIQLFDDYEASDPLAKEVIDEFAFQAAVGIYGLQSVLDLPRYAIGGGISARPETTQVVRDTVEKLFSSHPATPFSMPEIVTCHFGNEANLIGALAFHLKAQG